MKWHPPRIERELMESAPTRGPWIEIAGGYAGLRCARCRPPHGGRGLKFLMMILLHRPARVGPHTGAVD